MNEDTIEIVFDKEGLDNYLRHYFKINPRCRKIPIEKPMVRSLNQMLVITNRMVQNGHKQNYKKYAEFIVEEQGYDMIGITSTDLEVHFTFPTKIRHDLDNYLGGCKEIMDSYSSCGLIIDDDYKHVQSMKATASYEKGVTKMVFTFKNCKFDLDELKIVQEKNAITEAKRKATMDVKKKIKKAKSKTKYRNY